MPVRKASLAKPQSDDPRLNQALVAYGAGDFHRVEALTRECLTGHPEDVSALVLNGLALARMGRRDEAIESLTLAVGFDSLSFEAHTALSTLQFASQRPEEGRRHGQIAIDLAPDEPAAYLRLAQDLASHGYAPEAVGLLLGAQARLPKSSQIVTRLAMILGDLGQSAEAASAWEQSLALDPTNLAGWLKLGGIRLVALEAPPSGSHTVVQCGRHAVRLSPQHPDAHLLLALALAQSNATAEAEEHFRLAAKARPDEYLAHAGLGLVLQEQGRFDESRLPLERCLKVRPTHGQAYQLLTRIRKLKPEDGPFVERIGKALESDRTNALDRSYMHYALGKAREDLGDYETAIGHFRQGAGIAAEVWFAARPPDNDWYRQMIEQTIATFTQERILELAKNGNSSDRPILVVGMIRSGTSLIEQIVSAHRDVAGAGELTFWHDEAPKVFVPQTGRVDPSALSEASNAYLARLAEVSPSALRVTDKMPHNYVMLGLVAAAFPDAKVIHVRRHPVDNVTLRLHHALPEAAFVRPDPREHRFRLPTISPVDGSLALSTPGRPILGGRLRSDRRRPGARRQADHRLCRSALG